MEAERVTYVPSYEGDSLDLITKNLDAESLEDLRREVAKDFLSRYKYKRYEDGSVEITPPEISRRWERFEQVINVCRILGIPEPCPPEWYDQGHHYATYWATAHTKDIGNKTVRVSVVDLDVAFMKAREMAKGRGLLFSDPESAALAAYCIHIASRGEEKFFGGNPVRVDWCLALDCELSPVRWHEEPLEPDISRYVVSLPLA